MRRSFIFLLAALSALALAASAAAHGGGGASSEQFMTSAIEHPDGTATFPLHRGTSQGRTVYYLVLDASNGSRRPHSVSTSPRSWPTPLPAPPCSP